MVFNTHTSVKISEKLGLGFHDPLKPLFLGDSILTIPKRCYTSSPFELSPFLILTFCSKFTPFLELRKYEAIFRVSFSG